MVYKQNIFKNVFSKKEKPNSVPTVSFLQLYKYSTRLEKFWMFLAVISCFITGGMTVCSTYNFAQLAQAMINYGLNDYNNSTTNEENNAILKTQINYFCIGQALISVTNILFKYFAVCIFNYTAAQQVYRIKGMLFNAMLNWDISWYDTNQTGDLSSRLNSDMAKLEDGIGEKFGMFLHYCTAFILSVTVSFIVGWELSIITISLGPLIAGCIIYMTSVSTKFTKKGIEVYSKAGTIAEEVISSIRTVFAFGGQEKEVDRYQKNLVNAKNIAQKRDFYSGILSCLQWQLVQIINALGFWYGAYLVVNQRHLPPEEIVYTPMVMIWVFYSISLALWNMTVSSLFLESFGMAKAAGSKIFYLLEQESYIGNRNTGLRPTECHGSISFQNVVFKYPSRPESVILDGINMSFKKGEKVAIVGQSGCGKSTCIQLIQRLYDTSRGEILLDGINIKKLNVNWLRNNIGVVGQEPVLFGTTILENIRYGKLNATEQEIEEAAKIAHAHNFIKKLPLGYNTLVGERGAKLSGGQKQRIAIARAVIRNPKILLLDEATSALDSTSESKVQKALDRACEGRTTIVVAHRLSTIINSDKIVVIENGKVSEMGVHHDLMMQKKAYYNIVVSQLGDQLESVSDLQIVASIDSSSNDNENDDENDDCEPMPVLEKEKRVPEPKISVWTLIGYNKPEWIYISLGAIGALLLGFVAPLSAIAFGTLVSILSSPDDDYVLRQTDRYCLFYLIIALCSGLFAFFQVYMLGVAGDRLTERIRVLLFSSILKQEIGWFDKKSNGTGSLCSLLSTEASYLQGATGQRIGLFVHGFSVMFCSVFLTFYYEWSMGLLLLVLCPLLVFGMIAEKKKRYNEKKSKLKSTETSSSLVVEAISNIRTVVVLGCQEKLYNDYINLLTPALKRYLVNIHLRAILYAFISSLTHVATGPFVFYGGYLIFNDKIYVADIIKTLRGLAIIVVVMSNASSFTPNMIRGMEAARNIFAIINREPKIKDKINSKQIVQAEKFNGKVEFSTVNFTYPEHPNKVILQDLNLNANQGQKIALVGESGCGKSTCIQLLQRFYDPNSGKISLDVYNIQNLELQKLRSQMGIVLQEPMVFNRTIRENIAYGDNSRTVEDAEIFAVARQANIHDFITALPLGYDTKLGDKGSHISGGQKQRIAIARALIRNPKVILLDEATSALDSESEKVVQEALNEAEKGRTCITIAHRLQTIRDADVIYVIKSGKIVEKGIHQELYEQKGVYYDLCKMQCLH